MKRKKNNWERGELEIERPENTFQTGMQFLLAAVNNVFSYLRTTPSFLSCLIPLLEKNRQFHSRFIEA